MVLYAAWISFLQLALFQLVACSSTSEASTSPLGTRCVCSFGNGVTLELPSYERDRSVANRIDPHTSRAIGFPVTPASGPRGIPTQGFPYDWATRGAPVGVALVAARSSHSEEMISSELFDEDSDDNTGFMSEEELTSSLDEDNRYVAGESRGLEVPSKKHRTRFSQRRTRFSLRGTRFSQVELDLIEAAVRKSVSEGKPVDMQSLHQVVANHAYPSVYSKARRMRSLLYPDLAGAPKRKYMKYSAGEKSELWALAFKVGRRHYSKELVRHECPLPLRRHSLASVMRMLEKYHRFV